MGVCGVCGSSFATYQGLRIHQGKMGCTPKGLRISQGEQYKYPSYFPNYSYIPPPIKEEKPFTDIFTLFRKYEDEQNTKISLWEESRPKYSTPVSTTPVKKEPLQLSLMSSSSIQAIPAVTETNRSLFETPQVAHQTTALRALDFSTDATQPLHLSLTPSHSIQAIPAVTELNRSLFETPQRAHQPTTTARRALDFSTDATQPLQLSLTPSPSIQAIPAVTELNRSLFETLQRAHQPTTTAHRALDFSTDVTQPLQLSLMPSHSIQAIPAVTETNRSLFETPQLAHQTTSTARRALDFSTDATQSFQLSLMQTLSIQAIPARTETNRSLFETPQLAHQPTTTARQALDFSTDATQVDQMVWKPQTMTAQGQAVQLKEKEREAQKLLKARQDKMRAELQQKLQMSEQKMAQVTSSERASKGSLDAEWQEINSVFSEVVSVVEEARRKALQPLEDRRHRMEREARDLVQKLQREIDNLRETIDELDNNPDLQVPPLTGLDDSRGWKDATVDSSFALGTLRSITSTMMEQIQQQLESLSAVELKRIPTFAVDVKLDPTTAHRFLALSPDGKEVKDGEKDQKFPDSPERFDLFGSVLGLNRLTSGKSFWEVDVSNKTGWDLGVARRHANRKGTLSLTPDNGYWVTVHYEDKKYAALAAPSVSLSLKQKPQRVGVFVDYEEGLVSFYDMTAQSHIYSFTDCSFGGEILPYFSPHLHQNGKNSDPLIIIK